MEKGGFTCPPKTGKTNTARSFCLVFEIFQRHVSEGCRQFCRYPLWDGMHTWMGYYIYTSMKPPGCFSATLPYASLDLVEGCAHTAAHTRSAGP